jgi:hypothetical protein
MTKRRDYIPSNLEEFVPYQAQMCDLVHAHHKAWGIPKAVAKEFNERREHYEEVQKKAKNAMTRSRLDTLNHDRLRKEYIRYLRGVVQQYLAHNPAVNAGHKGSMRLVVTLVRRRNLKAIVEMADCYPEALGGLTVRFSCRVDGAGGRPKLHPECHMVEVEYMLLTEPTSLDHTTFVASGRHMSTRAQFKLTVGQAGQWIHTRARWVNTSDPGRSGGWGPIRMVMIH